MRQKMQRKSSTIFLIIFIFVFMVQSLCVTLNYNKNHSTITVFTPSKQSLILEIDFKSSDIHLSINLESQLDYIYLSKHNKNKLVLKTRQSHNRHQNKQKVQNQLIFDFQQKQVELNDGKVVKISGKIGLYPLNNLFLQLIRQSARKQSAKLNFYAQKQTLEIVYQNCHNTIKFPLSTKLFYEGKQKTISIKDISQKLLIDKSTVEFLFTPNVDSIFNIGIDEMQSKQVQVKINGHSKKIPLIQFTKPFCHKKVHTHNYSCDFRHVGREESQFGGFLMYFDFSICPDGIQIHTDNSENQETYYILHWILLFFIVIACILYSQDQIFVRWIKKLLKKKRYY